jgi:hypothetical protein
VSYHQPARLGFFGKLPCCFENRLAGKDLIDLSGPFAPNNALAINEKKVSLRCRRIPLRIQAAVAADYLKVWKVAQ